MNRIQLVTSIGLITVLFMCRSHAAPLGTAFTYQGRLSDGGAPASGSYDLRLELFDSDVGPNHIGNTLTNAGVGVTNGLFTTTLNFGGGIFNDTALWLQVGVRTNGSVADFTTLTPRQPLTPVPYALYAPSAGIASTSLAAPWAGLTGVPPGFLDGIDNDTLYSAGAGLTLSGTMFSVNFAGSGALDQAARSDHHHDSTYWKLIGNGGTTPGAHFLGTTDNRALELKVNNSRALRLEPTANSMNVIGGFVGNFVSAGVEGATIGGGGTLFFAEFGLAYTNRVFADFGTIGGGFGQTVRGVAGTVGGGFANSIATNAAFSTIGGGGQNKIRDDASIATISGGLHNSIETNSPGSTIAGGERNTILTNSGWSTIGGGERNTNLASAAWAVIGGGTQNLAAGNYGTVPGGRDNTAEGDYSFAAGRRAKANHDGSLVWADSTDADFASTAANQFLIRAGGGVGIGVNNPSTALEVAGTVKGTDFMGSGSALTALNGNNVTSGTVAEPRIDAAIARDSEILPAVLAGDGPGSGLNADLLDGLDSGAFASASHNHDATYWRRSGNAGTTPGTDFLGTTDNQALELKVNGARALRLEPNATGPNFIAGSAVNHVPGGIVGAAIGGGGSVNYFGFTYSNSVTADFGTVGGGWSNRLSGHSSVISGGFGNAVETGTDSGSIGGGSANLIRANADYATLSGGRQNTIQPNATSATIGGGDNNVILTNADYATVSGGRNNAIQNDALYASIGGGWLNTIESNALMSTIAGGNFNTIQLGAVNSTIGGGRLNTIERNAASSTIGGGTNNTILRDANQATIGGGIGNAIQTNAGYSTIGGGRDNTIEPNATYGKIGGGWLNSIATAASLSAIGGGYFNVIKSNADYSTIGGGRINVIQTNANYSTIGGGRQNTIETSLSAPAAGAGSTIAGGSFNTIQIDNVGATISGGTSNAIQGSGSSVTEGDTIGGGFANVIQTRCFYSTIGGGSRNTIQTLPAFSMSHATIGGGGENMIGSASEIADYATIPGGRQAKAVNSGQFAYASGRFATNGDAQTSMYVVRGTTTGTNLIDLYTSGDRMKLSPDSIWVFNALVVARSQAGLSAAYEITGAIERPGTNDTSFMLTSSTTTLHESFASWNAFAADSSPIVPSDPMLLGPTLNIRVKGSGGITLRWVAMVRTVEVSFP